MTAMSWLYWWFITLLVVQCQSRPLPLNWRKTVGCPGHVEHLEVEPSRDHGNELATETDNGATQPGPITYLASQPSTHVRKKPDEQLKQYKLRMKRYLDSDLDIELENGLYELREFDYENKKRPDITGQAEEFRRNLHPDTIAKKPNLGVKVHGNVGLNVASVSGNGEEQSVNEDQGGNSDTESQEQSLASQDGNSDRELKEASPASQDGNSNSEFQEPSPVMASPEDSEQPTPKHARYSHYKARHRKVKKHHKKKSDKMEPMMDLSKEVADKSERENDRIIEEYRDLEDDLLAVETDKPETDDDKEEQDPKDDTVMSSVLKNKKSKHTKTLNKEDDDNNDQKEPVVDLRNDDDDDELINKYKAIEDSLLGVENYKRETHDDEQKTIKITKRKLKVTPFRYPQYKPSHKPFTETDESEDDYDDQKESVADVRKKISQLSDQETDQTMEEYKMSKDTLLDVEDGKDETGDNIDEKNTKEDKVMTVLEENKELKPKIAHYPEYKARHRKIMETNTQILDNDDEEKKVELNSNNMITEESEQENSQIEKYNLSDDIAMSVDDKEGEDDYDDQKESEADMMKKITQFSDQENNQITEEYKISKHSRLDVEDDKDETSDNTDEKNTKEDKVMTVLEENKELKPKIARYPEYKASHEKIMETNTQISDDDEEKKVELNSNNMITEESEQDNSQIEKYNLSDDIAMSVYDKDNHENIDNKFHANSEEKVENTMFVKSNANSKDKTEIQTKITTKTEKTENELAHNTDRKIEETNFLHLYVFT